MQVCKHALTAFRSTYLVTLLSTQWLITRCSEVFILELTMLLPAWDKLSHNPKKVSNTPQNNNKATLLLQQPRHPPVLTHFLSHTCGWKTRVTVFRFDFLSVCGVLLLSIIRTSIGNVCWVFTLSIFDATCTFLLLDFRHQPVRASPPAATGGRRQAWWRRGRGEDERRDGWGGFTRDSQCWRSSCRCLF